MGAPILQSLLGNGFRVESAGMWKDCVGHRANECAIQCMRERGIDVSGHNGRWIGHLDLTKFSHIVCVNEEMAEKIGSFLEGNAKILVVNETGGGVLDPYDKGLFAYRGCLAILDRALLETANQILGLR